VLTIPIWTVCVRMQAERANEGEGKVPSPNAAERGAERDDDDEKKDFRDGVFSRTLGAFFSRGKARAAASSDGSVSSRASGSARGPFVPLVRKKTFLETTGAVWEENGLAGFWRGVVPSLIMVSNPALQYAFYESASDAFRRRRAKAQRKVAGSIPSGARDSRALTTWEVFVAASLAKMGATVLTYPVLLVKTRLQASAGKNRRREKTEADVGRRRRRAENDVRARGAFVRRRVRRAAPHRARGGRGGVLPRDGHEDDADRVRGGAHVRDQGGNRQSRARRE